MIYLRHIPAPPLNRYVEHFYYLDGRMPFPRERILPVPTLDLKINLGGAFRMEEAHHSGCPRSFAESWLVGLYGIYHTIDWPAEMRLYGVHFKPGGAYPFSGLPMSELYNQVVALDVLWGSFASEIRERLAAASTIQAGLALLERLMLARLCEKPHEQNIVDYAMTMIDRQHGALSIRELSHAIGISQNHLGTQFKRVVGTPVKELARLYRFEHVLRSIDPMHPVDWSGIAQQCGYYDQSHFHKDFQAFTGHTPAGYVRARRRVYIDNAQVDQLSLRTLPVD
jgi:AraC-like DNA-binding protein